MNKPLRRMSVALLVLFALLLINVNYVQVFQASSLEEKPGNTRTLLESYSRQRGSIIVGDKAIATSVETKDKRKYQRDYKNGKRYSPATGYYTLYNSTGVERAENSYLSGEDDRLFVRRTIDMLQGKEPRGADVKLTLNAKAQQAAYDGLRGHKGAAVAVDPKTGEILALATSPSYNPNRLAGHDDAEVERNYDALNDDPDKPLLNRALSARYPPGSTFKLITSAAALESGDYNQNTEIPSPNQYTLPQTNTQLQNFGGEVCGDGRHQSLKGALTISCNTAFAELGVKLGDEAVRKQAEKFGFGQTFKVPMTCAKSVFPSNPDPAQTAMSSIGQFEVAATPLQMAMVSSAIANKGILMNPYLVKEVTGQNLSSIETTTPEEHGRAVSGKTAKQLTTMMESVVENGTGTSAQIPGTKVAGKTGTAQHGEGEAPHAWFTGFAPANDPEIAVAVIVEDGGSQGSEATGGAVAAPIARAMMQSVVNG